MIIKTLVENTVDENSSNLRGQHGISLYLETSDKKILFDAGQDELFRENAEKLDVDITHVDYLIISHAHYDHAGGIKCFLEKNTKGKIILSENCLKDYYTRRTPLKYEYIGIDKSLYKENRERFITIKNYYELADNINLLNITETSGFKPAGNKKLFKKIEGKYMLDDFKHEIILAIKENENWIIFTGCAHSGITNMLNSFRKWFPENEIKALIGGFHLMNTRTKKIMVTPEVIESIAREISKFKIKMIYTGHCTGEEALKLLQHYLGDSIDAFRTGKEIMI